MPDNEVETEKTTWQPGIPEQEGWYWTRAVSSGAHVVVQFVWSFHDKAMRVRYPGKDGYLDTDPATDNSEWLGPITPEMVAERSALLARIQTQQKLISDLFGIGNRTANLSPKEQEIMKRARAALKGE